MKIVKEENIPNRIIMKRRKQICREFDEEKFPVQRSNLTKHFFNSCVLRSQKVVTLYPHIISYFIYFLPKIKKKAWTKNATILGTHNCNILLPITYLNCRVIYIDITYEHSLLGSEICHWKIHTWNFGFSYFFHKVENRCRFFFNFMAFFFVVSKNNT